MPELPGVNKPGGVLPNTMPDTTPVNLPAFWNDLNWVNRRILDLWGTDPKRAEEMLATVRNLMNWPDK